MVALSMLSRGSLEEKLQWAFSLYDIDGDGMVTRDEFTQIVTAIYDMMGQSTYPPVNNKLVQDHVSQVYEVSLNYTYLGVSKWESFSLAN